MATSNIRRSDRITLELPLEVSGDDVNHFAFVDRTRTAVISRHGAKIYSKRTLGRDAEVVVRCVSTGKEAEARIVGELGGSPEGFSYGIEFLNPDANIWGIDFPPISESEQATGRTLLECARCHNRELVYLEAMEVEVLETGQGLSRPCDSCTDITVWKIVREGADADLTGETAPGSAGDQTPPGRTQNERKDPRISAKFAAMIRHPYLGEEVVTAENVSPGGLCVRSVRRYRPETLVEVAFPHTPGGANVFVAARIIHANAAPEGQFFLYGLQYLTAREGWPPKKVEQT